MHGPVFQRRASMTRELPRDVVWPPLELRRFRRVLHASFSGIPNPCHNEWPQRPCGRRGLKTPEGKPHAAQGSCSLRAGASSAGTPGGPGASAEARDARPQVARASRRGPRAFCLRGSRKQGAKGDTRVQVGASSPSKSVPAKRRRGGPRTPKKGATSKPSAALDRPCRQRPFQGLQIESLRVNWAHPERCKVGHKAPWEESTHSRLAAELSPLPRLVLQPNQPPQVSAWTRQAFRFATPSRITPPAVGCTTPQGMRPSGRQLSEHQRQFITEPPANRIRGRLDSPAYLPWPFLCASFRASTRAG